MAASVSEPRVPTGLPSLGAMSWGTHVCLFYRADEDLLDAAVAYFAAGLAHGDRCVWVTSGELEAADARAALLEAVPDLTKRESAGQIEIVGPDDWYMRDGELDRARAINAWLEAERCAVNRGFAGLRICGDSHWVERDEWTSFMQYEAAIHGTFRARRIIALCTYALERVVVDDVLDVLRCHEVALLRRSGTWETIRTATQLVGAVDDVDPVPHADHVVHFFDDEGFPAEEIGRFLSEGAATGAAAAVVGTAARFSAIRAVVDARMPVRHYDVDSLLAGAVDANGALNMRSMRQAVTAIVDELTRHGRRAYLYGEIVDVLSRRGDAAAAVALERIWNELLAERPISLCCGYSAAAFRHAAGPAVYAEACAAHAGVTVDEDSLRLDADHRFVTEVLNEVLQRQRALDAARRRSEHAEREAHRRLAALQNVTAALAKQTTTADVLRAVRELTPLIGARRVDVTLDAESARGCATTRQWLTDADEIAHVHPDHDGASAVASLALAVGARRLGTIVFAFDEADPFDFRLRAFLEDVAQQTALALERVELYEETERHRQRELAASRAKDEFIAMLGHELRNPIAAIHTAAEVLRVVDGEAQRRRWHAVLARQIAHMTNILDDVLDVSRVTHGKITMERRALDVIAVLRDAVHDKTRQIAAKGLTLRTDFGAEGEVAVHGNRSRLMQVFDNLLDNAIKFTDAPGEIAVTCRLDEGQVVLAVSDTGAGIDPELLPHVFEPFTQGAQDSARSAGGLGLGLALVKQMIELHDGALGAESDGSGRGSKFTVVIPRAEWQPPGDVPPPDEPPELPPDEPPELPPNEPPEQPAPRPEEVPQRDELRSRAFRA